MLEDALRDDRTDIDNESTADLVSQIGRGLRGVNLNAPSLATESMYGDEYNDQSDALLASSNFVSSDKPRTICVCLVSISDRRVPRNSKRHSVILVPFTSPKSVTSNGGNRTVGAQDIRTYHWASILLPVTASQPSALNPRLSLATEPFLAAQQIAKWWPLFLLDYLLEARAHSRTRL